jgi:hypothetical protein
MNSREEAMGRFSLCFGKVDRKIQRFFNLEFILGARCWLAATPSLDVGAMLGFVQPPLWYPTSTLLQVVLSLELAREAIAR